MKVLFDIKEVASLAQSMALDQSRPCLFSGEFLDMLPPNHSTDAVRHVSAGEVTFGVRHERDASPRGISLHDGCYTPVQRYIAGGVTRASTADICKTKDSSTGGLVILAAEG